MQTWSNKQAITNHWFYETLTVDILEDMKTFSIISLFLNMWRVNKIAWLLMWHNIILFLNGCFLFSLLDYYIYAYENYQNIENRKYDSQNSDSKIKLVQP